jgi:ubiquinone/menaquinone biosynthesis C-methylase UbiE
MKSTPSAVTPSGSGNGRRKNGLNTAIESRQLRKKPIHEYKRFIQGHYDGFAGKLTGITGIITGHEALAGQVFKPNAFDLRGCKRILDAGCGNGRYSRFILKQADTDAFITGFDLSQRMLKRARRRIPNPRVSLSSADLTRLPYADGTFDAVVCGWVLEHLPDPRPGLRELARVLSPGGKLLLMTTEDTLTGSMCSRLWHCRTYGRGELANACQELGLGWSREFYFSQVHKFFRLGGIIVELRKE